jgi:hypothetical protein
MILAGAVAVAFWSYCGVLGVLSRSERPYLQSTLFHAATVAIFLALATAVAGTFIAIPSSHPLMTVPAFALVLIFGILIGFRYLSFLLAEYFDRMHASLTGISGMKVKKTYDLAEKAEHDGDFDRALALYREEIARDPKDPEPLRRTGDIHLRRGETTQAIEQFRRAVPLVEEAEPRSTLAFRLVDLLEREGLRDEARSVLRSIERELAGTRFAEFAKERLHSLT